MTNEEFQRSMLSMMKEMSQKIQDMDSRVKDIETRIQNMDSRMKDMETRMQNMDSRMKDIEARMQNMDSRIQVVESRMQTLEQKMDKLAHDLKEEHELTRSELKQEINYVFDQTKKNSKKIDEILTAINKLEIVSASNWVEILKLKNAR